MMAKIYTMLLVALSVMLATTRVKSLRRDSAGRLDMKAFVGKTNNNLGECHFDYKRKGLLEQYEEPLVKCLKNYDFSYTRMKTTDKSKTKIVCIGFVNKAKWIETCGGLDVVRAIAAASVDNKYEQVVNETIISQAFAMKETCKDKWDIEIDVPFNAETSDKAAAGQAAADAKAALDKAAADQAAADAKAVTDKAVADQAVAVQAAADARAVVDKAAADQAAADQAAADQAASKPKAPTPSRAGRNEVERTMETNMPEAEARSACFTNLMNANEDHTPVFIKPAEYLASSGPLDTFSEWCTKRKSCKKELQEALSTHNGEPLAGAAGEFQECCETGSLELIEVHSVRGGNGHSGSNFNTYKCFDKKEFTIRIYLSSSPEWTFQRGRESKKSSTAVPCFSSGASVDTWTADGTEATEQCQDLRRGVLVRLPNEPFKSNTIGKVNFVTLTKTKDATTLIQFSAQKGFGITPWHPIEVDGKWIFPQDLVDKPDKRSKAILDGTVSVTEVCNIMLTKEKERQHARVSVGGVIACTLGHELTNNKHGEASAVISHEFFGSYEKNSELFSEHVAPDGLVHIAGSHYSDSDLAANAKERKKSFFTFEA